METQQDAWRSEGRLHGLSLTALLCPTYERLSVVCRKQSPEPTTSWNSSISEPPKGAEESALARPSPVRSRGAQRALRDKGWVSKERIHFLTP